MKIGNTDINKLYIGSTEVTKVYLGSTVVYEPIDYRTVPLTFEIQSDGDIIWKASNTDNIRTIEYSKNSGEWASITSTTGGTSISVVSGDTIQFRGNNTSYSTNTSYNSCFNGSTCSFSVEGNIMSLINSTDFANLTTLESAYTFCGLFKNCTGLTDASNLILPATTLLNYCYSNMFYSCRSLTTAPVLPATTIAIGCYSSMFQSCTSLVNAPALPSTTLAESCYNMMFTNCDSLTTAPVLPATTLVTYCYQRMFNSCDNLNYIKCLATDISATNCTYYWASGILTNSGTFVTPSTTNWTTGYSGIPTNWTRVNA